MAAKLSFTIDPVIGTPPELVMCAPSSLYIDPAYQRDMAAKSSQALVREIAAHWDWSLCLPLVVSRRSGLTERLFVIDGQHRLAAARLRGDVARLPCVIGVFDGVADEAGRFVALNRNRRPLSALDLFKAAMASGEGEAAKIAALLAEAGLSLARHINYTAWKPGQLANIGGLKSALRVFGEEAFGAGLTVFAQAFGGQVLRYAGTILPGVIAVCADIMAEGPGVTDKFERLQTMLARRSQADWRGDVMQARIVYPALRYDAASAMGIRRAWQGFRPDPVTPAPAPLRVRAVQLAPARSASPSLQAGGWCNQCDMKVSAAAAGACKSRFCSFRKGN
jgi:hypothetical protein